MQHPMGIYFGSKIVFSAFSEFGLFPGLVPCPGKSLWLFRLTKRKWYKIVQYVNRKQGKKYGRVWWETCDNQSQQQGVLYHWPMADRPCLACYVRGNRNRWYDFSSIHFFLLCSTFSSFNWRRSVRVGISGISLLFFLISWNVLPFVNSMSPFARMWRFSMTFRFLVRCTRIIGLPLVP